MRHEALNCLGVRQWYSKYLLPNAASSPVFEVALVQSSDVSLSDSAQALFLAENINDKKISSNNLLVDKLNDQCIEPSAIDIVTKKSESDEKSLIACSALSPVADIVGMKLSDKLTLSFMRFDRFVVLYELEESYEERLENHLLDAIILMILGFSGTANKQKNSQLIWPVFDSEAIKKTQVNYFESVLRRWLERKDWLDCDYLLYFGKNYEGLETVFLSVMAAYDSDCSILPFRFSLSDLLTSSSKKKKLWEFISNAGLIRG